MSWNNKCPDCGNQNTDCECPIPNKGPVIDCLDKCTSPNCDCTNYCMLWDKYIPARYEIMPPHANGSYVWIYKDGKPWMSNVERTVAIEIVKMSKDSRSMYSEIQELKSQVKEARNAALSEAIEKVKYLICGSRVEPLEVIEILEGLNIKP